MAPNRPGTRLRTAFTLGLSTALLSSLLAHLLVTAHPATAWLAAAPVTYRFLLAPPLDRRGPSRLTTLRFSWLPALVLTAAVALSSPALPATTACLALLAGLATATLANAADAYRVSLLRPRELGPAAGLFLAGAHTGAALGAALGLSLATGVASAAALVLLFAGLLALPSAARRLPPEQASDRPPTLESALLSPLRDLAERPHAAELAACLILLPLPAALTAPAAALLAPATATAQAVHFAFTLTGLLAGGFAQAWLGAYPALWTAALCAAASKLLLWASAESALPAAATLALDALCAGAALSAAHGLALSLCRRSFAATQAALLTALTGVSLSATALSPFLLHYLGVSLYLLSCSVAAIPALLLLARYRDWTRHGALPPLT